MKQTKLNTALSAALLVSGAALACGSARADTVFTFDGAGPNSEVVEMVGANGQTYGVYAGAYQGQLGSAAGQGAVQNIFCVDFTHDIQNGDSYTTDAANLITASAASKTSGGYYNGGLASALNSADFNPSGAMSDAQRASEVAYLADTYLDAPAATFTNGGQVTFTGSMAGSANVTNNLTAISLSIWDIMQDGGNGLGTGSVDLYDNVGTSTSGLYNYSLLTDLSSYYEQQAAANATYQSNTADWIQAPIAGNGSHLQDYVVEGNGPMPNGLPAAPEPAGFLPFVFGVAGIGALAFARRRKSVAAGSAAA